MVRSNAPSTESTARGVSNFQSEMDHLLSSFFRPMRQEGITGWLPPINVSESAADYEVAVELPGLSPVDVNVELHDGRLTISGERKSETQSEERQYHRVEQVYGKFERVLKLGMPVNEEAVEANYNQGILTVRIPKSEQAKPRRIEIKST
ncbi:MAG: Hsp20/alpha crystallin family protein [Pirellulaceae bacterium]